MEEFHLRKTNHIAPLALSAAALLLPLLSARVRLASLRCLRLLAPSEQVGHLGDSWQFALACPMTPLGRTPGKAGDSRRTIVIHLMFML